MKKTSAYIIDLDKVNEKDFPLVGTESIAHSAFYKTSAYVPFSFVVSSLAFDDFIMLNELVDPIFVALQDVRPFDRRSAEMASQDIVKLLDEAPFPQRLENELRDKYKYIVKEYATKSLSVEFSHIVEKRFIPESNRDLEQFGIKGEAEFLFAIKDFWKQFFSTESIEMRANGYYNGALTTALLIKKQVRSDISGVIYSIPPITKEDNMLELQAIYGIDTGEAELQEYEDVYKVSINPLMITEKHIVPQEYMKIITGSEQDKIDKYTKVEISKAWKKQQKVSDEKILELSKIVIELENKLDKPLEVEFALEAGTVFLVDIKYVEDIQLYGEGNTFEKDSFLKQFVVKDPLEKKEDVNLDKLEKEIELMINKDSDYIDSVKGQNKNVSILDEERDRAFLVYPKWTEQYRLITDIYLDISRLHVQNLSSIGLFNGTYFDGTELLLDLKHLPESKKLEINKKKEIIDSFALDILTATKNTGEEPCIYQFSSIGAYEHKLLQSPEKFKQSIGDERFIVYPEALLYELQAIKKVRQQYSQEYISLCIPSLRNVVNLNDIKSMISSFGFRRTKKFKMYAEIAIPSFLYDIDKVDRTSVDGFVINYDILGSHLVMKQELSDKDHDIIFKQLDSLRKQTKEKDLEFIVRVNSTDEYLFDKILSLEPHGIIFVKMPKEKDMKFLQEKEKSYLDPKKSFFTKL